MLDHMLNKEKIAVLVDSGSDISKEIKERYHIYTIGLKVVYGSEIYTDDVDIESSMIYQRFPNEIPTTSTPNLSDIQELLKKIQSDGYDKVLAVCISSKLSSTMNNIRLALEECEGLEGHVVDTKNISIGSGLVAIWAAEQIEQGIGFSDLVKTMEQKILDSHVYFYMDTLDYLRAGGRIGNVTGMIGKALNLKPIITCDEEGVYRTITMLRGRKNAVAKLVNLVRSETKTEKVWLAIMHGDAPEQVAVVRQLLQEKFKEARIIVEKQIAPTLAVHTGPGLIGVGVLNL